MSDRLRKPVRFYVFFLLSRLIKCREVQWPAVLYTNRALAGNLRYLSVFNTVAKISRAWELNNGRFFFLFFSRYVGGRGPLTRLVLKKKKKYATPVRDRASPRPDLWIPRQFWNVTQSYSLRISDFKLQFIQFQHFTAAPVFPDIYFLYIQPTELDKGKKFPRASPK